LVEKIDDGLHEKPIDPIALQFHNDRLNAESRQPPYHSQSTYPYFFENKTGEGEFENLKIFKFEGEKNLILGGKHRVTSKKNILNVNKNFMDWSIGTLGKEYPMWKSRTSCTVCL